MIPCLSICASADLDVKDGMTRNRAPVYLPSWEGQRSAQQRQKVVLPSRLCDSIMLIDASASLWFTNRVALTIRSSQSANFRRKTRQGGICGEISA